MISDGNKTNPIDHSSLFNYWLSQSKPAYFLYLHLRVIYGVSNWVAIEEFGLAKEEWFIELFGLKNGIPSYDTFGEGYAAIDVGQFSVYFFRWVADLANITAEWDNDYLLRVLGLI